MANVASTVKIAADAKLLRFALKLDAMGSGANGVVYVVTAALFGEMFGLPAAFLYPAGAFLVAWAAALFFLASRPTVSKVAVRRRDGCQHRLGGRERGAAHRRLVPADRLWHRTGDRTGGSGRRLHRPAVRRSSQDRVNSLQSIGARPCAGAGTESHRPRSAHRMRSGRAVTMR